MSPVKPQHDTVECYFVAFLRALLVRLDRMSTRNHFMCIRITKLGQIIHKIALNQDNMRIIFRTLVLRHTK